ncbi:MAG: cbb3-type cytochrome c oxidase subunit I, partial [Limisphaerales bacterium]
LQGSYSKLSSNPVLLFAGFWIASFLIAGLMRIFEVFLNFQQQLHFTWFDPARSLLNFYGFFAMLMFGAIYYILPQVTGLDFPAPKLVRTHFWLAGIGVVLFVAPLAAGGIVQAVHLQNPEIQFLDISRSSLMFLRVSTLGDLLMLVGHLVLACNAVALAVRCYQSSAVAAYSEATADLFKPAEVKS